MSVFLTKAEPDGIGLDATISSNRTCAMGIAIITIMIFHLEIFPFTIFGHWGVDIFMFVSGFGIFYSLNKSGANDNWTFYKKRVLRIMPAACISGTIIGLINYFFSEIAIYRFGLPCGLDHLIFASGLRLWYIRSILLLYLISPFLFCLIKKNLTSPIILLVIVLSVLATIITIRLNVLYINQPWRALTLSIPTTIVRFPAFWVGMWIGHIGHQYRLNRLRATLIAIVLLIPALLLRTGVIPDTTSIEGLNRSIELILVIPFIILFCANLNLLTDKLPAFIVKGFLWAGGYSLELYLVHEATFNIFFRTLGMKYSHAIVVLLAVLTSIILAYLLKLSANKITKRFFSPTLQSVR